MIITLILIAILIGGIICLFINEEIYSEVLTAITIPLLMVGVIGSLLCVGMVIGINATQDIEYQNTLYEKEMLEYRIEHMEENITGNEMLYNDIVEFNNNLRSTKKWANNPWTNWFNNQKIASIDYVVIDNNTK